MVLRRCICIYSRLVCFAILVAIALHAEALEPEQVFEKASPSVVTVETLDITGSIVSFGSGVVIAPGEVITNCHVVEDRVRLRVRKGGHTSPAYVRFYDKTRAFSIDIPFTFSLHSRDRRPAGFAMRIASGS